MARAVDKPQPTPFSFLAGNIHAPAAATAAVVTKAAVSGKYHVIRRIDYSYSATPTGGNLKIEDVSGTVVFSIDIPAAGPGFVDFGEEGIRGAAVNTAMIVTLASGAGAVVGKVNITKYSLQERA